MPGTIAFGSSQFQNMLELIIDPQTCGPLAVACSKKTAKKLISMGSWTEIGNVDEVVNDST